MAAKIPMLLALLWANNVTYTSPTPVVTASDSALPVRAGYSTINMRPPWVRTVSRAIFRCVVTVEVLAIAAPYFQHQGQQFPASLQTILAWTGCHGVRLTPTFILGWIMSMLGASIRVACYRAMGKLFTFEVTIRKDHRLVTSGPYSVVRHPSYTALCMVASGTLLCLYGRGSWLAECALKSWTGKAFALVWMAELLYPMYVMVFLRVKTEDEMLKKTFGREWEEWASRTPYRLVPGLY